MHPEVVGRTQIPVAWPLLFASALTSLPATRRAWPTGRPTRKIGVEKSLGFRVRIPSIADTAARVKRPKHEDQELHSDRQAIDNS